MLYGCLHHQPRAGATAVGILIEQVTVDPEPPAALSDANRRPAPAVRVPRQRSTINAVVTKDRMNARLTTKRCDEPRIAGRRCCKSPACFAIERKLKFAHQWIAEINLVEPLTSHIQQM